MSDIHDPLTCELCHAEGIVAEIADWRSRLEAAEGERDAAFKDRDAALKARDHAWQQMDRAIDAVADTELERAELRGERDRLREAALAVDQFVERDEGWVVFADRSVEPGKAAIALLDLRAALSTGDRQEQTFGGTGAEVLPEPNDGHETAGGAS